MILPLILYISNNSQWLNWLILIKNVIKFIFVLKLPITLNYLSDDYIIKGYFFPTNEYILFFPTSLIEYTIN